MAYKILAEAAPGLTLDNREREAYRAQPGQLAPGYRRVLVEYTLPEGYHRKGDRSIIDFSERNQSHES